MRNGRSWEPLCARVLVKAIDEPDRRLTRALVEEYDPDPVNA